MGISHGRHRSDLLATKLAHELQPPAGQPRMHHNIQEEAKANPNKKENAQKTDSEGTKKGRKKNRRTSDQPRKGRKESFSKYVPGYVPTNPVDEELGGLFDAADYDDPYTIAREKLQNLPKPATMPTTQHDRARYTPPRYQPRGGPTSYQPVHGKTVHQNTKHYYGANANDFIYLDSVCNDKHESGEYPNWHDAEDNTEGTSHDDLSCDGNSAHSHDNDTGCGAPPDQIEHHTGGSGDEYGHNDFNYDGDTGADQDIGGAHDAGGYDVEVDTGASCDVGVDAGPSYDFGGDTGGGYDCGGSYDAGGI